MLLDSQLSFSSAQAVTATGDTASTNVYDTGTALDDGTGEPAYIVVTTVAAVTSGGAATVTPVIQDSADNSSWSDRLVGTTYALAALTANTRLLATRLPIGLRRYVRVVYRVGTAVLTGGTFNAFIAKDIDALQYGTSGFTV